MVEDEGYVKIGALAVDETHVYWGGNGGWLMRRALDGRGKEEHIGSWYGTTLGLEVAVDQDYVYWLDVGEWYRAPKAGGARTLLPLEAQGGDVAADQQYAYAALVDCASVARVPHGGTTSEIIYPAEPVTGSPGRTFLTLDGQDLYCAGGHYVFVSHNWGPLEMITSNGVELNGVAVVDGEPYWLDMTPTGNETNLFRRSADGQITLVGTRNTSSPRKPIADAPRRRILFTNADNVWSWSIVTGESKLLIAQEGRGGTQVARDKDFFYWGRYTLSYVSIERMPIGQE